MENSLLGSYPIHIEKKNFRYTLNVKENDEGGLHVTIIARTLDPEHKTKKIFEYTKDYEYEAFDEVNYILNEQINRTMLFCDREAESCLLDILIEFDKYKDTYLRE